MKLTLHVLLTLAVMCFYTTAFGQTTVLDFETEETSTTFQYFGSSLDGSLTEIIDNPDASGINTSGKVMQFVKPTGAQVWAGGFSNPDPTRNIDFTSNNKICIKVWMPRPGNVALKLENSISGGDNWVINAETTVAGEWVELCYDATLPSIEAPFNPAAGHVYTRLVIFAYFQQEPGAEDEVVYIDDFITKPAASATTVVLDFEAEETSTIFQYFGSALDGQTTTIIANPDPSGINTSANVMSYIKPDDAQVWAGAFSNPDPTIPVDLSNGGEICVKVWSSAPGNLAIKLENSPSGDNWITTQQIEEGGKWVELCFNSAEPSIEGPNTPASGHLYERIVIFFDFGTAGGGVEKTFYMDDLVVVGGGSSVSTVKFSVNTSELGAISSPVYLIGEFNDWSQSLPMTSVGDGVYEVDVELGNGVYEYKYMIGDAENIEEFSILDECTITTADGEFTNRRVVVSGEATLPPVCFNSCYNCGESVSITINLGMGEATPDESGVYVAGGQAFDAPGGRFRLQDADGDGVFSITFERGVGFTSYYTFTNGACPDYSCKEMISGQDCANPDNFDDRLMDPVMSDLVINTCFGICSNSTDCTVSVESAPLLEGFELFPNITEREIYLTRGAAYTGELRISLLSIQGTILDQFLMGAHEERKQMDVSKLSNGLYLMLLQSEVESKTLKFVKQ